MAASTTARPTEEKVPETFSEVTALNWLQQRCNHNTNQGKGTSDLNRNH